MKDSCSYPRCDACPRGVQVVCHCIGVTTDEVVTMIETLGLRTVKEVRTHTGAGDGCTCCHTQIRELIEQAAPSLAAAG